MPRSEVMRPSDWDEVAATLGRNVRDRRRELGLTQEGLAELMGVHRNQVQNIEKSRNNIDGTSNPKLDMLWALAIALEVDVADLLPRRHP